MTKYTFDFTAEPRAGGKDVWNAFMLNGARFTNNDIPYCESNASILPAGLIAYNDTKSLANKDFFVHFYLDDYKFDGKNGIWSNPYKALERLKNYKGVITPDFSPYQDMPEPLKIYNIFRSRTFGYWLTQNNISVINNVRWGTEETFRYCFDGIPKYSVVAIGTVASGLREKNNRKRFEIGFYEMLLRINPKKIIIYGSSNYECFESARNMGIEIIQFHSKTALAFMEKGWHND